MTASSSRRCGICDRAVADYATMPASLKGVPVCRRCHGRPVTIRTARPDPRLPAVYTFYVGSLSGGGGEWTVKRFRRQMTCNCPDFLHRGQVLMVPCKHVRLVRLLARAAGSWTAVPPGTTLRFRLADPRSATQSQA